MSASPARMFPTDSIRNTEDHVMTGAARLFLGPQGRAHSSSSAVLVVSLSPRWNQEADSSDCIIFGRQSFLTYLDIWGSY